MDISNGLFHRRGINSKQSMDGTHVNEVLVPYNKAFLIELSTVSKLVR